MRKREKLFKREKLDFPSAKPIICVVRVSGFADLFDLEHFIHSLKSDVRIVKQLPRNFDKREIRKLHSMVPVSWSSMAYYKKVLVPLLKQHKVSLHRQPSQHFATSHADAHSDTSSHPPPPPPELPFPSSGPPTRLCAGRLHPRVRLEARQQQSEGAPRASEAAL